MPLPDPRGYSDEKLRSDIGQLFQSITMELDGPDAILKRIEFLFCKTGCELTYEGINAQYQENLTYLQQIKAECVERRLVGPDTEKTKQLQIKLHTTIRAMAHLREAAVNMVRFKGITLTKVASAEDDFMLDNLGLSDADKEWNNRQEVLETFTNLVYRHQLRRCGTSLYKEKLISMSTHTFYWELSCSIEDFVWINSSNSINSDLWKKMTMMHGLHDTVIKHLEKSQGDPRIRDISPSRYWLSWMNGIYSVEQNEFFSYEDAILKVPSTVMTCKFFNEIFDISAIAAASKPELIYTPSFDTLLQTQHLSSQQHFISDAGYLFYRHPDYPGKTPVRIMTYNRKPYCKETAILDDRGDEGHEKTKIVTDSGIRVELNDILLDDRWQAETNEMATLIFMAMLGRMLYTFRDSEGHMRDNWQKILFIKGLAGTGKSTIAAVMKNIYPANQVGTINSRCEENFPIYACYDKYCWMCPEVRYNFMLDTALFQSMVSGDPISVAIKNKDAVAVDWNIPGLLIGNQFPKMWADAGGSIIRRVLLANYREVPGQVDPGLVDRILTTEMSAVIVKLNSSYLKLRQLLKSAGKTLDDILPLYFRVTRSLLMNEVHTLYYFLSNEGENIELGEKFFVSLREFRSQFNIFCGNKGLPQQKWTPDFYTMPLLKYKLKIVQGTKRVDKYDVKGTFVEGLRFLIKEESERGGR